MGVAPIAVFAIVFAVVVGAFWLFVQRPEQKLQEALHRRLKGEADEAAAGETATIERGPRERRRLEGLATRTGSGLLRSTALLLERADIDMEPARLLAVSAIAGVAGAFVLSAISPLHLVTIPLGLAAGWLPVAWVRYKANRRLSQFEEQFPEAIELIARALRAGHAMTTGLALVAEELPEPVGAEFRLVYDRQNFGMSMPDALRRESGGNLAEILDNLGDVIRQRFRVRRQIKVVTAHARLTGWVLVSMPLVIAAVMVVAAPDHILTLVKDPLGVHMTFAAIGLWVIGFLVIRRLIDVEY
jgi:tight adherence protein B